jgi:hypothetical protein
MKRKINFQVKNFTKFEDSNSKKLKIEGQKLRPPSKRITFNQKSLKIIGAKIIYKHKKSDIEFELKRINHVKSFGEVRLHTNNILYPGNYTVILTYTGDLDEESLKANQAQ